MALPHRAIAPLALALLVALPGCLSGPGASTWAYRMVQLDQLDGGGAGVTVAILDTGINVRHPSLDHLVDGDRQNGELIAYRDFLDGGQGVGEARDPDGHGSHVAGILAARGGGGVGDRLVSGDVELLGGAPAVRLVVARVCNAETCPGQAIVAGIRWATAQGADVLSLSLGGQAGLPPVLAEIVEDQMTDAINDAIDRGVVVVASAGNCGNAAREGCQGADDVNTPAAISGVIAVGAVDSKGRVASFSSGGDNAGNPCRPLPLAGLSGRCDPNKKPELVAPGVDIVGAWTGRTYVTVSGTSQATPFVTAAVAHMLAGRPDLNDRDDVLAVKRALVDTAKPVTGQDRPHDAEAGYGILQARSAVDRYRR